MTKTTTTADALTRPVGTIDDVMQKRGLKYRTQLIQSGAVFAALILWELAALGTSKLILPAPSEIAVAGWETIVSGELLANIQISYFRVLVGWALGFALAVPLGILAGRSKLARVMLEPFTNFFRFIPPIAFITLFLIWLGLGESSKIALIAYATFFVMFLSTTAGVQRLPVERSRAAECMGASKSRVLSSIVLPGIVPDIVTAGRVAMGNAFMTVVAAELVAAESGVGFMIMSARLFARTDIVFVGIVALGLMGLVTDLVFRLIARRIAYRYDLKF
ncbi:MAG: ABC transporter permease [Salinibacterium amurskyense]